jgi:hypothetical protein
MLSNEWIHAFDRNEKYKEVSESISFVISTCDSVKFARYEPDADIQKKTIEEAISIIKASCWVQQNESLKGGDHA